MERWIALMGKRNTPTDGVEDYCTFLGQALARRGVELEQVHVGWNERGWKAALRDLETRSADWRGQWIFLQYTALAWSSRGFPFGILRAFRVLERRGARVGIVFHEYRGQEIGHFAVQPARAAAQEYVIGRLYKRSAVSVFTVPPGRISWLPASHSKAAFIPIGANIPEPPAVRKDAAGGAEKTVTVFCFTPSPNRELEIGDIVHAAQTAHRDGRRIQLSILGRGSKEVLPDIERGLAGCGVRVSASGIVSSDEISRALAESDALLFVSGQVSQTRGSALAGVACGLPIVGYAGEAEGTAIAEAGLQLVPFRSREALGEALVSVLGDAGLQRELRRRSLEAQRKYFSWDAIAEQYVAACLRGTAVETARHEARQSSLRSPEIS